MKRKSLSGHRLNQLDVSINEHQELVLSGKNRGRKTFSQTLPASAPCVIVWDEETDNFMTFSIIGDIPDTAELVDVVLRLEE